MPLSTCTSEGIRDFLAEVGVAGDIPHFPLADIETSPLSIYTSFIANTIVQLTECSPEAAWASVQKPNDPNDLGDLAVIVPRLKLKNVKPAELAETTLQLQKTVSAYLIQYFLIHTNHYQCLGYQFPTSLFYEHPFEDGINLRFFFKPNTLARLMLAYIVDRGKNYGTNASAGLRDPSNPDSGKKKVLVEYSSPNIGKPFDGIHSRSTLLGAYISSLFETMGWDVVRTNFVGDWGKQIGLLAAGWQRFKSDEAFQANGMGHLLDVFKQINELSQAERNDPAFAEGTGLDGEKDDFFRRLEDQDPEALSLWKDFRSAFMAGYAKLYERLDITFDDEGGESAFKQETIDKIETCLKEKGLYEESDGAWIFNFEKLEIQGWRNTIARYRNGTTSYLLRDIAAYCERKEKYSPDMMLYVASSQQSTHFHQLFKILEILGYEDVETQLKHISINALQIKKDAAEENSSGIVLEDVLDKCRSAVQTLVEVDRESMAEFSPDNAALMDALAITGLKIQDFSHKHNTAFTVDVEKLATTDGHTGLALQQWYCALKQKLSGVTITREELDIAELTAFEKDEYADVLRILIQFPDIVKSTFKQAPFESASLVTYLFRLIDGLESIWESEEDEAGGSSSAAQNVAELALFECVRQVLENGMRVLGIKPVEL
jgi:arginyl-tRNA synthetase